MAPKIPLFSSFQDFNYSIFPLFSSFHVLPFKIFGITLKECQNKKRRHPNAGTQTPAPVAYVLTRFGENTDKTESSDFKSRTQRFPQKETGVPAAGTYDQNCEIVRNKSFRIYREKAPFESGAARFDAKKFQENVTKLV